MTIPEVIVKERVIEKVKNYNPWIYNNEIITSPKDIIKGQLVSIKTKNNTFLGIGYFNKDSKITIRFLNFLKKVEINKKFFHERIKKALELRKKINSNAFRIIHSEADFLPGLIIDNYNGYISVQFNTAGIENFRKEILDSIIDIFNPKGIIDKSDNKAREKEKIFLIDNDERVLHKKIPLNIAIDENQIKFYIDFFNSQKTGFYLDQRANRLACSEFSKNNYKVLDLFCNSGGFGIYFLKRNINFCKFIDVSDIALHNLSKNLKLNNIKDKFEILKANVFDYLEVKGTNDKFNFIIIDPPSFAKRYVEKKGALKGFKFLISRSLDILEKGGFVSIFSCSYHITLEDLFKLINAVAKRKNKRIRILKILTQDIDHPMILNISNSFYLKGILFQSF